MPEPFKATPNMHHSHAALNSVIHNTELSNQKCLETLETDDNGGEEVYRTRFCTPNVWKGTSQDVSDRREPQEGGNMWGFYITAGIQL